MNLDRLSLDLSAALEDARHRAERRSVAYIQPKHLLLALLDDGGGLDRAVAGAALNVQAAFDNVGRTGEQSGARLEPGRHAIAGRALRDLLEQATAIADRHGVLNIGPLEVAIAAASGPDLELS